MRSTVATNYGERTTLLSGVSSVYQTDNETCEREFNSVAPTTQNDTQKADLDYQPDRLKLFVFILTFAIKTFIIMAISYMRKGAAGSFLVILSSASELPALLRMSLIEKSLSVRTRWAFSYFVVVGQIIPQVIHRCKRLWKFS